MKTREFIAALGEIEKHGNLDPMVQLFAADAQIWNPELPKPLLGQEGARQFWREYRATFASVHSEFRAIIEGQDACALEWLSTGTLEANGQSFEYQGVSVVAWADDRITRFAAYFDPRALATGPLRPITARQAATRAGGSSGASAAS